MTIEYSSRFKRSFKKLDRQLQLIAWQKLELFKQNQNDPRLKTHKLQHTKYYAFSITYKIRIIFLPLPEAIILVNVGNHSLYQKL